MANPEQLAILKQGVKVWNEWRNTTLIQKGPEFKPDLSDADLSAADLSQAILEKTDLTATNLTKANLTNTNLIAADLSAAILSGAILVGANLSWAQLGKADLSFANLTRALLGRADLMAADLRGAVLTGANLGVADLRGAILSGADFDKAIIEQTVFGDVDLSEAKGLETVIHFGPATISIDTIYKSKGNIPEAFLRGTGVPENFITYMRSLTGKAFDYYSCFISYSSKDADFATRLHADLQSHGLRVWFAPDDMKIGDRLHETIDAAVRLYDKLMVVLSINSIESAWVEREVKTALAKEKPGKAPVLFPLRLDDAVMNATQQWAHDIKRNRHIGDFSKWKDHDAYQKSFERLLRDLKAEGGAGGMKAEDGGSAAGDELTRTI